MSDLAHPAQAAGFPVVGVGASAGGLQALTRFVEALPVDSGIAYILVQHLDPNHDSLLADLLAQHSKLPIAEARERTIIAPDQIYVIPAGLYLSVVSGALHLQEPAVPHGARLPIDFLFKSMAADLGSRACAIVLSGTDSDGTKGIKSIRDQGGFTIAQDPTEAEYDAMPKSAAAGACVDRVLSVTAMPMELLEHFRDSPGKADLKPDAQAASFADIIGLLREKTGHDFTHYKMGILQRRIERRMALASIPLTDMARYLAALDKDSAERDLLASDMLINVTSFSRYANVFDLLTTTIVPQIVNQHTEGRPLRIWVAGCSTGEEAYSLAMVFTEAIAASGRTIKLCVLASDVDGDAVTTARRGQYPESIASDVSKDPCLRWRGWLLPQALRRSSDRRYCARLRPWRPIVPLFLEAAARRTA